MEKLAIPFVLPEHRTARAGGISLYGFLGSACPNQLTADDIVLPGSSGFAAEIFLTAFKVKAGPAACFTTRGPEADGPQCQPSAIIGRSPGRRVGDGQLASTGTAAFR